MIAAERYFREVLVISMYKFQAKCETCGTNYEHGEITLKEIFYSFQPHQNWIFFELLNRLEYRVHSDHLASIAEEGNLIVYRSFFFKKTIFFFKFFNCVYVWRRNSSDHHKQAIILIILNSAGPIIIQIALFEVDIDDSHSDSTVTSSESDN